MPPTTNPVSKDLPMEVATAGRQPVDSGQRPAPPAVIQADSLFMNAQEVLIQHKGDLYHLRITRNDKLILTK